MSDEYLDWLSQYMVMKRASIEMNFHPLYSNFVDQIKKGRLHDLLVKETLRNIEVWFLIAFSHCRIWRSFGIMYLTLRWRAHSGFHLLSRLLENSMILLVKDAPSHCGFYELIIVYKMERGHIRM